MTLSALWPLCLLPLIGMIIIFYLLKQPSKEKVLSSLTFWQSVYKQQYSKKPWEKFRQDLLMYLQILTVLFLIISLCAPIINSTKRKEQIMLILDTSASMQTLYSADGTTRLEQAKKEAKKLLNSSKNRPEVTIISCSDQPQILLSSSTDRKKINTVLDNIQAQDCAGTLNNAIALCESVYSQWKHGTCVFFTDSSLHTASLPAQIYDLSTSTASPKEPLLNCNLSLNFLRASIDKENNLELSVQISNFGKEDADSVEINYYLNGSIIDVQTLDNLTISTDTFVSSRAIPLPEHIEFPLLLKAELQEKDALAADNITYSVYYGDIRENRVLLATKQNSFLESALSSYHQNDTYKISSMEDYNPNDTYDLYIFDGMFPDTLPKTGSVLLLPDGNHMKSSATALSELLPELSCNDIVKNSYLNLASSPVSTNLENCFFPTAKTLTLTPPANAEAIFTLDNGTIGGYTERINGRILTVFGFDLHDTDFPLQTDFPILMYNILNESLAHHDFSVSIYNESVTAGETITFYPAAAGKKVSIRNESGKEVKTLTPSSGLSANTALYQCGIYDFYTKAEKHHAYLPVVFPSYKSEGDILAVPEFTSSSQKTATVQKASGGYGLPVQKLLIILSLLFLTVEFIIWIRRQWNKSHRLFFLAARIFLVLLLCLSIMDFHITLGKGTETTLFLVDVSDSMKKDLSTIESDLNQAIRDLPSGTEAGIIAFGSDSRVEHFISKHVHFNKLETTPVTTATNLENALQTAVSMFSSDDSRRIVLLTDGQENEGTVKNMASTLKDNQISLKVMRFSKDTRDEVLISKVRVPEKLTVGESFQAEVTVISNVNTNATLSLYSGDTLKGSKQVSLTSGNNHFLFQDTLTKDGLTGYRAIIETEQDTETINNEYLTFTQAEKKQNILLIEGKKGEAAEFEKLLKACKISYKKILPFSAPRKLLSLKKYPLVICENVHADDLPDGFKNILESYVQEGGGFIATGGDNSFALGNYQNTSLERILPVSSVLHGSREVPETAMALVIDHSGSMGDGNRHTTRLDLAKEAALSALNSLRKTDSIGVLAFDDSYDWVVPFTKASDTEAAQQGISSIKIQGGTSIYPALDEAVKTLSNQPAKLKHIILLTDGEDGFRNYQDLYETMEKENITLSTVAVSDGADTGLLKSMAEAGNGRYYYTDISTDIPRIFSQEVFLSSDSYLINKEFEPTVLGSSLISVTEPLLEDALPPLYGYIRTTKKPQSSELIKSDSEDPILAINNDGLGVTAAFTTDVTNEWTKDYAGLDSYARFWKKLIKYCIRNIDNYDLSNLEVTAEGNTASISYVPSIIDMGTHEIQAICTDEDGNSRQFSLDPSSENTWRADIPLEHTGIYSLTLTDTITWTTNTESFNSDGTQEKETNTMTTVRTSAFATTYSREYQLYDDGSTLDSLISLTNAEVISTPAEFYTGTLERNASSHSLTPLFLLLALLLFILDIAIRRFGIPKFLHSQRHWETIVSLLVSQRLKPLQSSAHKSEAGNSSQNIDKDILKEPAASSAERPQTEQNKETSGMGQNSKKETRTKTKRQRLNQHIEQKNTVELLDTSKLLTSRKPKKKN